MERYTHSQLFVLIHSTQPGLVGAFPTAFCDIGVYLKWQITKPLRSESAFHAEKTKSHMSSIYKFWCLEWLQDQKE